LKLPHVKFIYPTAPEIAVTMSGGIKRNAWFDIAHPDLMGVRDEPSVAASVGYVKELVAAEVAAGTPESRIVLAGFSQGGHITLRTTSQLTRPLAGAIGLGTWCEAPSQAVPEAVQQMPVFVGHGAEDPLVPVALAEQTAAGLRKAGLRNVELHKYRGLGHSTNAEELGDVRAFLLRVIPDAPPTRDEVEGMSVKELRALLGSRGISTLGFLEKREFMDAALAAIR